MFDIMRCWFKCKVGSSQPPPNVSSFVLRLNNTWGLALGFWFRGSTHFISLLCLSMMLFFFWYIFMSLLFLVFCTSVEQVIGMWSWGNWVLHTPAAAVDRGVSFPTISQKIVTLNWTFWFCGYHYFSCSS